MMVHDMGEWFGASGVTRGHDEVVMAIFAKRIASKFSMIDA